VKASSDAKERDGISANLLLLSLSWAFWREDGHFSVFFLC
jgi:hypothetical protein